MQHDSLNCLYVLLLCSGQGEEDSPLKKHFQELFNPVAGVDERDEC